MLACGLYFYLFLPLSSLLLPFHMGRTKQSTTPSSFLLFLPLLSPYFFFPPLSSLSSSFLLSLDALDGFRQLQTALDSIRRPQTAPDGLKRKSIAKRTKGRMRALTQGRTGKKNKCGAVLQRTIPPKLLYLTVSMKEGRPVFHYASYLRMREANFAPIFFFFFRVEHCPPNSSRELTLAALTFWFFIFLVIMLLSFSPVHTTLCIALTGQVEARKEIQLTTVFPSRAHILFI